MKLSLFLMTYGTVFLMELAGDKTLYTVSMLATRYRPLPILCGIVIAFMAKMLAAVLLGQAIAELPAALVAGVSAVTFFTMALVIWLKDPESELAQSPEPACYRSKAALISFAAIFFSEWGDVGQIAVVTLAARYQAPLIIWLSATLAMATKGMLAMALGMSLRTRVPRSVLRYGALGLCLVMGILSALRMGT